MAEESRRRNARGEGGRLREDIVDSALDLMASSGSDEGLTLRGVARAVGVSPQSVYLHFDTLDALVHEGVRCSLVDLRAALDAAIESLTDPVERLVTHARTYVRWGLDHPGLYQVAFEGRAQRKSPESVQVGRAMRMLVQRDVEAAVAAGRLQPADPELVAFSLWAFLHGVVSLHVNRPHVPWPDVDAFVELGVPRLLGLGPASA